MAGKGKDNERNWRQLPDDRRSKERAVEYRVACERIGQYDAYAMGFNRVYVGILTAAILARYYCTSLSGGTILWSAMLAFVVLHIAVAVIRSVNQQFIDYCRAYWTTKPKLDQSLSQYMERTAWETFLAVGKNLKKGVRAGPIVPTFGCMILLVAGLLLIKPKTDGTETVKAREVTARVFRVEGVVDGDTFVVRYDDKPRSVRIVGIDAPDLGTKAGQESRAALQALILRKDVRLQFIANGKEDDSGLLHAWVSDGKENIGAAMVNSGHADRTRYALY